MTRGVSRCGLAETKVRVAYVCLRIPMSVLLLQAPVVGFCWSRVQTLSFVETLTCLSPGPLAAGEETPGFKL